MSNFPSAPPPGAYVPPTEGNHAPQASTPAVNPQQQYYQQQAQGPAPSYGGAPQHPGPHKSQGIGQIFNQAVTTGKPMFNKFSKQISAKLSGKQPAQPTPAPTAQTRRFNIPILNNKLGLPTSPGFPFNSDSKFRRQ